MTELVLTPSQTSGPLFGFCLLFDGSDRAAPVAGGTDGPVPVCLAGTVVDGPGHPYGLPRGSSKCGTASSGRGRALTPTARSGCTSPTGGQTPDGQFLAQYFNIAVFGVGLLKQRITRLYLPDEQAANEKDAVLRLVPEEDRGRLIGTFEDAGTLQFQIVLQGPGETPTFGW